MMYVFPSAIYAVPPLFLNTRCECYGGSEMSTDDLISTQKRKNVVVVGGGAAGMVLSNAHLIRIPTNKE